MTDKRIAESLVSVKASTSGQSAQPPAPRAVIPAQTGKATRIPPPQPAAGSSIVGPLIETAYTDRTYWSDRRGASTDGLFTCRPPKTIKTKDANNVEVVLAFKEPAFTAWNMPLGPVWGDPWHGLLRDNGGGAWKLVLPNGSEVTWVNPGTSGYGLVTDSFLVKVPDQPAVAHSEPELNSDVAAGRQWRNYALMGGAGRLLYKKQLDTSGQKWLYVAADKSVWLVDASNVVKSGGNVQGSVTLSRFGEFGVPAESYTRTLTSVNTGVTIAGNAYLYDIKSDGSEAVFGVPYVDQAAALVTLGITGSGASIAATLSLHRNRSACRPSISNQTNSSDYDYDFAYVSQFGNALGGYCDVNCTGGVRTISGKVVRATSTESSVLQGTSGAIIGAIYDDGDVLRDVTVDLTKISKTGRVDAEIDFSGTGTAQSSSCSTDVSNGPRSGTLTFHEDRIQYVTFLSVSCTIYCNGNGTAVKAEGDWRLVHVNNVTFDLTKSAPPPDFNWFVAAAVTQGFKAEVDDVIDRSELGGTDVDIFSANFLPQESGQIVYESAGNYFRSTWGGLVITPRRRSNKLYGCDIVRTSVAKWVGKCVSADGEHGSGAQLSSWSAPWYASLQPVTKQYSAAELPRTWV